MKYKTNCYVERIRNFVLEHTKNLCTNNLSFVEIYSWCASAKICRWKIRSHLFLFIHFVYLTVSQLKCHFLCCTLYRLNAGECRKLNGKISASIFLNSASLVSHNLNQEIVTRAFVICYECSGECVCMGVCVCVYVYAFLCACIFVFSHHHLFLFTN